jgi:ribosomal-protein-alanine N-acetyltransferase
MGAGPDVTLQTERLLLRPFRKSDYDAVHAYASDPEVTRYTSFGPNTPQETRDFLQRSAAAQTRVPRLDYGFALVLRENDRLIGGAGLYLRENEPRIAELGYVLHRDFWGEGYAPEAVRALIDLGFRELGIHRIYARYHPQNRASARVMEKAGMQYEGVMRESAFVKGAWWDFGQYAILSQEWV